MLSLHIFFLNFILKDNNKTNVEKRREKGKHEIVRLKKDLRDEGSKTEKEVA